jgi:integrase
MPLELRWKVNGQLRPFWYGRYEVNGKRFCSNLGIKITGTLPASQSLKDEGDTAFERSRAQAQARLDTIVEEARTQQGSARLVEKLYEIKTGESLKSTKLADLPEAWAAMPRKRKPSGRYLEQSKVTLERFAEFAARENPKADEVSHVTRTLAQGFMDEEAKRGVTARTRNDTLSLLRTAFKALLPAGVVNPFLSVLMQEAEPVFRKAFSPDELKSIMEAAREDEFIRPLLVTGMCTAMRRGDCCLLQWKDVDLERRFITVKTAKTRQTVSIPIFPLLEQELKGKAEGRMMKDEFSAALSAMEDGGADLQADRNGYVFPEQAAMYRANPTGITWRVKKVLAAALGAKVALPTVELPEVSEAEVRERGENFIGSLPEGEKRERMRAVFQQYMEGGSINAVVSATGVSKASVSDYLGAIEKGAGCKIVRGRPDGQSFAARLKSHPGLLLEARECGKRRASVRDFHSFRVTWVTLALSAGVPLELVQKVTGHKTTDIVLKHYFQPGREAFREALNKAMPALLTAGERGSSYVSSPANGTEDRQSLERVREILSKMTAKSWKKDRERVMGMLGAMGR